MKRRIIIYSVLLGLLAALTGVGLFNLVVNTRYKNNEVSFKLYCKGNGINFRNNLEGWIIDLIMNDSLSNPQIVVLIF